MRCADPRFGVVAGLARTLRNELLIDLSILEIDCYNSAAIQTVYDVFVHIGNSRLGDPPYDYEFVLHNDTVHIARLDVTYLHNQLQMQPPDDVCVKAEFQGHGLLGDISWGPAERAILRDDEVEVEVHYVGLNFKVIHPSKRKTTTPEAERANRVVRILSKLWGSLDTSYKLATRRPAL